MHEPGHSSRGSGGDVVVGGAVAFVVCGRGFWVDAIRLLSQQTEPLLQLDVLGIKTEGLSQNAAIMFSKQNPGHLGRGALIDGIWSLKNLLFAGKFQNYLLK